VAGQHDGPPDAVEQVRDGGGVRAEAAERVGRGDDAVTGGVKPPDDAVPTRGLGEGAVDEDDGRLHDAVPPVLLVALWTLCLVDPDVLTLGHGVGRGISHPTPGRGPAPVPVCGYST
jgi:hypothetical protein